MHDQQQEEQTSTLSVHLSHFPKQNTSKTKHISLLSSPSLVVIVVVASVAQVLTQADQRALQEVPRRSTNKKTDIVPATTSKSRQRSTATSPMSAMGLAQQLSEERAENKRLHEENEELSNNVADLENEKAELNAKLNERNGKYNELKEKCHRLNDTYNKYKAENGSLTRVIKTLQASLQTAKDELRKAQKASPDERADDVVKKLVPHVKMYAFRNKKFSREDDLDNLCKTMYDKIHKDIWPDGSDSRGYKSQEEFVRIYRQDVSSVLSERRQYRQGRMYTACEGTKGGNKVLFCVLYAKPCCFALFRVLSRSWKSSYFGQD